MAGKLEMAVTETPEIGWFAFGPNGFAAWIGERTKPLLHAHDLTMRDADLETVTGFMEAKARRTSPFAITELSINDDGQDIQLPLSGESWELP